MEKEKYIEEAKFFTNAELLAFKDLEIQQIKTVYYHYWVNKANQQETVELLDLIEFRFIDNTTLMLKSSELCDCIEIVALDLVEEKKKLLDKFKGAILIKSIDKTNDPMWSRVIDYPVSEVLLDNNGLNKFYSDKIQIDFAHVRVMISITQMGLHVEEVTEHNN